MANAVIPISDERYIEILEDAIRHLWNSWASAEGEGQPEIATFGDAEMDAYLAETGEPVPTRPSAEVQAVIRELLRTSR